MSNTKTDCRHCSDTARARVRAMGKGLAGTCRPCWVRRIRHYGLEALDLTAAEAAEVLGSAVSLETQKETQ